MRDHTDIRIHTKIDHATYGQALEKCRECGFDSIYQLLRVLVVCYCRYIDQDYDMRFDEGMDMAIYEMLDNIPGLHLQTGKDVPTGQQPE